MKRVVVLAWLLLACGVAHAIDTLPPLEDAALQKRYDTITHQLRCPKCQNEAISDSDAQVAGDLRLKVRQLLLAGRSDEEVYRYMNDRYGDFVLYKPPLEPRTLLLWAAPTLFVVIGVITALIIIMRRSRLPDAESSDGEADPT